MRPAHDLKNIAEVAVYWQECLKQLDDGAPERQVASQMVKVVSNSKDSNWSSGHESHPAYPFIFELAASLELPDELTTERQERWNCIRALLQAMMVDISARGFTA